MEDVVCQSSAGSVEHEETCLIPLGTGFLSDEVRGEVIVKEVGAHLGRHTAAAGGRLGTERRLPPVDHLKPFIHSSKPFLYCATLSAGPIIRMKYGPFLLSKITPNMR